MRTISQGDVTSKMAVAVMRTVDSWLEVPLMAVTVLAS